MNIFKSIVISNLLVFSAFTYAENKFQIIDRGIDGNQRQYMVTCKDGNRTSVTKYFEMKKVPLDLPEKGVPTAQTTSSPKLVKTCISNVKGEETCRNTWELESAARASCTQ